MQAKIVRRPVACMQCTTGSINRLQIRKLSQKKELEMKYVKAILCMLATTPRSICL